MSPHPQHLLRSHGSRLTQLIQHAAALDRLTKTVRQLLPPAVSPHCRGTAWRGKTVTVFVDSSVWTTRVRFHQHDLKNGLKRQFQMDVRRIRVKVAPRRVVAPTPPGKPLTMTAATRELLDSTANGIGDPDLADALRRLGRKDS